MSDTQITTATEFDPGRAILRDHDMFRPLRVKTTRPLEQALAQGEVDSQAPVLVLSYAAGTIVLLTEQMAYHHVAQGEIDGQPWLASF